MYDLLSCLKDGEKLLCDVRFCLACTFLVSMHMPTNEISAWADLRDPSRSDGWGGRLERERKMLVRGILMSFLSCYLAGVE